MGKTSAAEGTRSTGNVFRDLGFPDPEAEHLLVRTDLMIRIEKEIRARGLKQADCARLLGVSQPRVSDLLHGRVDLFSTDKLIDLLARLGIRVRVTAQPMVRVRQVARASKPQPRPPRARRPGRGRGGPGA